MSDLDRLLLTSGAFIGRSRYLDSIPALEERPSRIYVRFHPHGTDTSFLALLDTGGHFCILSREVANSIRSQLGDPFDSTKLWTAHGLIRGELHRHTIELIGEGGHGLDIEVTVFVSPDWIGTSFLGYSGVLERVRFCIDPGSNSFYFGSL